MVTTVVFVMIGRASVWMGPDRVENIQMCLESP